MPAASRLIGTLFDGRGSEPSRDRQGAIWTRSHLPDVGVDLQFQGFQ